MALVGFCVVMGIVTSAAAIFSFRDLQITISLAAATNLVLTALTGKSVYTNVHIQC
jgi:hypothetical protein